jgi:hypothetical protein
MQITMSRTVSLALFTAALAAAATFGYVGGVSAQQRVTYPGVLTGEDIGFRPTAQNSAIGILVIRIGGEWVPVQFVQDLPRVRPLGQ